MLSRNVVTLTRFAALGILVMPAAAHAYLDPGTGSVIVQFIVGGVVAVGFFLKTQWHRLTSFFSRGKKNKK